MGRPSMAELSAKGAVAHGQSQRPAADELARRWGESIGLAAAVGIGYFVAARLGVGLVLKPAGVAVFWPAAGISAGVLIALGLPRCGIAGGGRRDRRNCRDSRIDRGPSLGRYGLGP
jgi:hypothetical protein